MRAVEPDVTKRFGSSIRHTTCLLIALAASACAGTTPNKGTTSQASVVEMDELRITAARNQEGYRFDVYDANDLFTHATDLLNHQKCHEAVELYDRLVSEFATSRFASASLYNAGLCLQALGDFAGAAQHYGDLRDRFPTPRIARTRASDTPRSWCSSSAGRS